MADEKPLGLLGMFANAPAAMPENYATGIYDPLAKLLFGLGGAGVSGALAPGRAYNSTEPVTTSQMVGPSLDLASLLTLGAGAVPAEANSLRAGIRPYQSTIDALMGFKKNGPQRGFSETAYPHVQDVEVTLPATSYAPRDTFYDQIRGLNADHATERAYRNWPAAMHVTPIFPKK